MKIKASERMGSSDGHFLASQQEAIKKLTTAGHNVINLERGNPDLYWVKIRTITLFVTTK
ncbi:hypothetical protein JCM5176_09530 [Streptococcus sobrinus]|nr:aspartate aminotransferase, truncated [Streptococcus sobrinus]